MGDPGLWGLMSLAHGMPLSGDVFAVIPNHQPIQSYEDYYTATSNYFEGEWHNQYLCMNQILLKVKKILKFL